MRHPFQISFFSVLLFCGCGNLDNQSTEEEYADSTFRSLPAGPLVTKEFATQSGKSWAVSLTQMGASLVNVTVETKGFTEENRSIYFTEIDPVISIFQADLDKNGFEELYLVTQAVGSGSYATIYGMSSNNDRSVSEIYFEGATPYNSKSGDAYDGYMGHDEFVLQDGILVNTYPVYREGDTDANPTGGKRRVIYGLVQGESSMQLKPIRGENVN